MVVVIELNGKDSVYRPLCCYATAKTLLPIKDPVGEVAHHFLLYVAMQHKEIGTSNSIWRGQTESSQYVVRTVKSHNTAICSIFMLVFYSLFLINNIV